MYSGTCLRQPPVGQLYLTFIERWLHYRGRLQCFSAAIVPVGAREDGCFREVNAVTILDRFRCINEAACIKKDVFDVVYSALKLI